MRAPLVTKFGSLCFVLFLIPAVLSAQSDFRPPLPVFEFHSGFWLNLHHTLYFQARQLRSAGTTPVLGASNLTSAEQRAWDAAVSFYSQAYAGKDLLVALDLVLIKNQLGDFETCDDIAGLKKKTCDAGLPKRLTEVLTGAAARD